MNYIAENKLQPNVTIAFSYKDDSLAKKINNQTVKLQNSYVTPTEDVYRDFKVELTHQKRFNVSFSNLQTNPREVSVNLTIINNKYPYN